MMPGRAELMTIRYIAPAGRLAYCANATVEGLLRMTQDKEPPVGGDPPVADAVTPGDEPSALERGARIFERLRRRKRPAAGTPESQRD